MQQHRKTGTLMFVAVERTKERHSRLSISTTWTSRIDRAEEQQQKKKMPVQKRNFEFEYEVEPADARSAEYLFVKYFNVLMCFVYLASSIWIYFFIFAQADWERNANMEDIRTYVGVTTWTWWTVAVVTLADILVVPFLVYAVWNDKKPGFLLLLATLAYVYSLYGIVSVYLRGSIVCFVFPFVIATLSVIQFLMARHENEEFEITKGLRLREREPTMEQFLRD